MTYIWNRAERVPHEHTLNIQNSFNTWLSEQHNKLKNEQDQKKIKNIKKVIARQTELFQDAIISKKLLN